MNKKLLKRIAVASLAAFLTIPNITTPLNISKTYAIGNVNLNSFVLVAESGVYTVSRFDKQGKIQMFYKPSSGWVKSGNEYYNPYCGYAYDAVPSKKKPFAGLMPYTKEELLVYGIDPDLGIINLNLDKYNTVNQNNINYLRSVGYIISDWNTRDLSSPMYLRDDFSLTPNITFGVEQGIYKNGTGWMWTPDMGYVYFQNGVRMGKFEYLGWMGWAPQADGTFSRGSKSIDGSTTFVYNPTTNKVTVYTINTKFGQYKEKDYNEW